MRVLMMIIGAILLLPVAIVLAAVILFGLLGGVAYLVFELFGGLIITVLLIIGAVKLIKSFTSKK